MSERGDRMMIDEWCREERCRHRHWSSGTVPTHRRGKDCPLPIREHVARDWHNKSSHGKLPFDGESCDCFAVAKRIMPMLADAWENGHDTATDSSPGDIWFDAWTDNTNPYEETTA